MPANFFLPLFFFYGSLLLSVLKASSSSVGRGLIFPPRSRVGGVTCSGSRLWLSSPRAATAKGTPFTNLKFATSLSFSRSKSWPLAEGCYCTCVFFFFFFLGTRSLITLLGCVRKCGWGAYHPSYVYKESSSSCCYYPAAPVQPADWWKVRDKTGRGSS